jgi:hypothetical protein
MTPPAEQQQLVLCNFVQPWQQVQPERLWVPAPAFFAACTHQALHSCTAAASEQLLAGTTSWLAPRQHA